MSFFHNSFEAEINPPLGRAFGRGAVPRVPRRRPRSARRPRESGAGAGAVAVARPVGYRRYATWLALAPTTPAQAVLATAITSSVTTTVSMLQCAYGNDGTTIKQDSSNSRPEFVSRCESRRADLPSARSVSLGRDLCSPAKTSSDSASDARANQSQVTQVRKASPPNSMSRRPASVIWAGRGTTSLLVIQPLSVGSRMNR